MSITLDVNAFLNKDICSTGCNDISIEREVNANIFDEIEHLLRFNKNLEHESQQKEEKHKTKPDESKTEDTLNLNFFDTSTDDFLLTSDSQSLLGEDLILYVVEKDRLQPVSSRFMVPGIYKRIESVASNDKMLSERKSNVFISHCEKEGRIVSQKDFERLYLMSEQYGAPILKRVILLEALETDGTNDENVECRGNKDVSKKPAKDLDALNRLAYDILKLTNRDHIVIDRKRNEIVRTQFDTQQKTIYRFLSPQILGMKPSNENEKKNIEKETKPQIINKLGRPRKKFSKEKNLKKNKNKEAEKSDKSPVTSKMVTKSNINFKTRYGRIIKTPNHSQENLLFFLRPPSPQPITDLLKDLKDLDFQYSKINNTQQQSLDTAVITSLVQDTPQRKIPPEAICPTCRKIFLGKRLQRHFVQHPEHIQISQKTVNNSQTSSTNNVLQPSEEMSLFRFLISKLQRPQNLNEDQKADIFLNELNDLAEQLQCRSSRLIRNASGLHFVNQRCSKVLGIPEGQYALDISAIESPIDPELAVQYNSSQNFHSQPNNISTGSLDYTSLSITLDDTITDEAAQKLNLSAGGKLLPPSEESLLRAVGDLVETNIEKIHGSSILKQHQVNNISSLSSLSNTTAVLAELLPPHIDHASDNAVEAVHMKENKTAVSADDSHMLDLSVDFFQFNN